MMTHLDHDRPKQERVKCVVVGDSGVGKTRLICARARKSKFTLRELCGPHVPTVWAIDQYHQHQEVLENSWEVVDDVSVTLRLWDTFGCHDKDRKFAFGRSDVVALCFSITNSLSLRHCVDKWWPEIRRFCPKTPIILIGCRNDMRHMWKDSAYSKIVRDERRRVKETDIIMPERGRAVAAQIGAVGYYESSVLTEFGVTSVFTNVIRAALVHRRQTRFWASHLKNVKNPEFQSPYLVPAPPVPERVITVSTWMDDLREMADRPKFADVEFVCADEISVFAHSTLLAAASPELASILSGSCSVPTDDNRTCFTNFEIINNSDVDIQKMVRLTLRSEFISRALEQLVHFLYSGVLDMTPETVHPLQVLSQGLDIPILTKVIAIRLSGDEEDTNAMLGQQFVAERDKRLAAFSLDGINAHADVDLVTETGQVPACRAILSQRSSFMAAMLCGSFQESHQRKIHLADIESNVLRSCLYYLYLDRGPVTEDVYGAMDVLAAADRFCLIRLMDLLQAHIIATYLQLPGDEEGNGSRVECAVAQRTLELLEPAEAYHASHLYNWCFHYLSTHYVFIYRHHLFQFRSLTPRHQALLSKQRWPPVWYISEYDLYEQSLEKRRQEMLELLRKRRSRFTMHNRPLSQHGALGGNEEDFRPRATSEPPRRGEGVVPHPLRREASSRWRLLLCSR